MSEPVAQAPRAAVHDLGYRRYLGTRRPQHTRWRAVVKNMLRMAWQGYWRAKVWIFGSATVVAAIGFGMAIVLETSRKARDALSAVSLGEASSGANHGAKMIAENLSKGLDQALAQSFHFLPWMAFVLTLTAIAGTVSRDLGAGAFEFYFSRPVRSVDYVVGKIGGAIILVGAPLFAAPVALSLFRVGVDWENIGSTWTRIPQTALIGALATLLFATVPLALSALVVKPRSALVLWAIFWVLVSNIAGAAATATGIDFLYALDPYGLVLGVTYGFYGMKEFAFRPLPGLGLSIVCLLGYSTAAVALLFIRVRQIERAGIGGS